MSDSKINRIRIDLQLACEGADIPDDSQFEHYVKSALVSSYLNLEQTIRIVSTQESQQLNRDYRGKDSPTNVLSFVSEDNELMPYDYLGDLVICAEVVEREAQEQGKSIQSHWAHMVVHGMLHLQGFDHVDPAEAEKMESLEIEIMQSLGHTNPYK